MSRNQNPPDIQSGRRQFLKSTVTASGAGLLSAKAGNIAAKEVKPPYTTPFVEPLPVYKPKVATDSLSPPPQETAAPGECGRGTHQRWREFLPRKFYEIHVKELQHSFHRELPKQLLWGYDGMVPGPTFEARYGEPIVVRIYNDLPANTIGFGSPEISTHLHNLHVASESDGFTGNYYSATKYGPALTGPGRFQDYHYPNIYAGYDQYRATRGDPREALGTLFYHDHRLDFTAGNVLRGLTGFYLLFDDIDSGNEYDTNPKALRLPSGIGEHDIPLVFTDKKFDSGGYLVFDQFDPEGTLGNTILVNGKVQPYFRVARRKYRFRLLDGGPMRFYEFYLVHNNQDQAFTYIANDGNLLPAPLTMTNVRLGVAERADIIIDFAKYPIGSQLVLVNRLEQLSGRGPTGTILNPGAPVLRFEVDRDPPTPDVSRVPFKLRELPPLPANLKRIKTREWDIDRENEVWTINSKVFDVFQVSAEIKRGTEEIWEFKGHGSWSHPLHIHFEEGRILTRNGKPPPPHEQGRKDVYVLHPEERLRIFIRFRDFNGKYMMHCHNLVHEDHAMMIRFDIVSPIS